MGIVAGRPSYRRQRFLLSFVNELVGGVKSTDLQKLVFLHTMSGDSDFYEFVPFRHGAYSFQLAADLDTLHAHGHFKVERLQEGQEKTVTAVISCPKENHPFKTAPERGIELMRRAYREHPYYTIRSEILADLFFGKELESFNRIRQTYAKKEPILFTIGYEGRNLEAFINQLIQNDVRLLCDVRKNALSRKFGYSKRKLGEIAESVGIKYVHIPGLGIESANRQSLETKEDFQDLFEVYEKTMSLRISELNQLESLLRKYFRVALMCFEREPSMCHRHVIRDYVTHKCRVKSIDL